MGQIVMLVEPDKRGDKAVARRLEPPSVGPARAWARFLLADGSMVTFFSLDIPTANACPACDGERAVEVALAEGGLRFETCSWCDGCGFVELRRVAEWHAREREREPEGR